VGRGRKAEPVLAALANGTAGVSLEMDEGNRWGGGHPAIHVLPATLAVAEELEHGGHDVPVGERAPGAARRRPLGVAPLERRLGSEERPGDGLERAQDRRVRDVPAAEQTISQPY